MLAWTDSAHRMLGREIMNQTQEVARELSILNSRPGSPGGPTSGRHIAPECRPNVAECRAGPRFMGVFLPLGEVSWLQPATATDDSFSLHSCGEPRIHNSCGDEPPVWRASWGRSRPHLSGYTRVLLASHMSGYPCSLPVTPLPPPPPPTLSSQPPSPSPQRRSLYRPSL